MGITGGDPGLILPPAATGRPLRLVNDQDRLSRWVAVLSGWGTATVDI
ncbi:hypothetical protein ABN034_10925 [Actinopolymorpha sp. B11F2]